MADVDISTLGSVMKTAIDGVSDTNFVTDAEKIKLSNTSGTNTGDQTSVSGNAGTATALQNARTIGGVSFNGTADIVPQTIQVADAASDTTTFVLLAGSATGNLQPLTDAGIAYNASTNVLTVNTSGTSSNLSAASTIATATATIDAAALLGQDIISWTPSASTHASGTFVTGKMRKTIIDTTNGAIVSPGHAIGGYDYIEITAGANTIDLAFGHESKLKKSNAGALLNFSFYKPAIDTITGTVTNIILYDGDMDLSGVTYTNAYLMKCNRSYLTFETSGKIVGATGNEVPTSVWPSVTTGRAYFPRGYASTGTLAYTQGLTVCGPPIVIPERTTFTKIGVNVTTGVASSVARLGIYKMGTGGQPGALVLDAGTVTTATTGEREITISQSLEAGAYFLAYQSTGGSAPTISTLVYAVPFCVELFGQATGDPASGNSIDIQYFANTGALTNPFNASPTRTYLGAVPAVYLKK